MSEARKILFCSFIQCWSIKYIIEIKLFKLKVTEEAYIKSWFYLREKNNRTEKISLLCATGLT